MAAKSEGLNSSPSSSFQLQTNTIRNSAPFKAKSADVFGSLDTMERDYNSTVSKRVIGVDGVPADDEGEAVEGSIKRGCIFRKPQVSGQKGSKAGFVASDSGTSSFDKTSRPYLTSRSPDKRPPTTATAGRDSSTDRKDNTFFHKPDSRACKIYVGRRGRGSSNARGRHRPADHVLNPHKYTKYSLEETNMCGNSANRSIALGFLSELRKRKHGENPAGQESDTKDQFVFQKPREARTLDQAEQATKTAYGSVYKIAEYEVGKAPAPQNKKPRISSMLGTPGTAVQPEKPGARPVISLDHFEKEDSIDDEAYVAHSVSQSECSNRSVTVDTEKSEQSKATHCEGMAFKSNKGKGKRHLRGRQEDT